MSEVKSLPGLLARVAIYSVLGNFIYQAIGPGEYLVATERTFFQVWTLGLVWVIDATDRFFARC